MYNEFTRMTKPTTDLFTNTNQTPTTNKNVKIDENTKNITTTDPVDDVYNQSSINDLISFFQHINPSYKTLYSNKSERASLQRMIDEHGKANIVKAIQSLIKINGDPYSPVITSPIAVSYTHLDVYKRQSVRSEN